MENFPFDNDDRLACNKQREMMTFIFICAKIRDVRDENNSICLLMDFSFPKQIVANSIRDKVREKLKSQPSFDIECEFYRKGREHEMIVKLALGREKKNIDKFVVKYLLNEPIN